MVLRIGFEGNIAFVLVLLLVLITVFDLVLRLILILVRLGFFSF